MVRRTYIEEIEDPITGEVTVYEADSLEELEALIELTVNAYVRQG